MKTNHQRGTKKRKDKVQKAGLVSKKLTTKGVSLTFGDCGPYDGHRGAARAKKAVKRALNQAQRRDGKALVKKGGDL